VVRDLPLPQNSHHLIGFDKFNKYILMQREKAYLVIKIFYGSAQLNLVALLHGRITTIKIVLCAHTFDKDTAVIPRKTSISMEAWPPSYCIVRQIISDIKYTTHTHHLAKCSTSSIAIIPVFRCTGDQSWIADPDDLRKQQLAVFSVLLTNNLAPLSSHDISSNKKQKISFTGAIISFWHRVCLVWVTCWLP
jgi:hypothetical protein